MAEATEADAVAAAVKAIDKAMTLLEASVDYRPDQAKAAIQLADATVEAARTILARWGTDADIDATLTRARQAHVYLEAVNAARGL